MYREAILRELWSELDSLMYQLMTDGAPTEEEPPSAWQEWGEIRGKAQGTAFAIAMISNMSDPNVESVRAEAVRRWQNELEGKRNPAVPDSPGTPALFGDRRGDGCLAMAFGVTGSPCHVHHAWSQGKLF